MGMHHIVIRSSERDAVTLAASKTPNQTAIVTVKMMRTVIGALRIISVKPAAATPRSQQTSAARIRKPSG
jgi:hypothetical protein